LRFPTKLRYCDNYQISIATAGVPSYQVWMVNSLFDPDVTGTGHQPMYFDQLAAMYLNYTVYKCVITVRIVPKDTYPITCCLLSGQANDFSTYTMEAIREQKLAKTRLVAGQYNAITMRKTVNIAKILGKTNDAILNDNVYNTSVGSNPGDAVYCALIVDDTNLTSATGVYVEVDLEYHCIFTQLKDVGQS